MIVISDGTPVDDTTSILNGRDYLKNHLPGVIDIIESSKKVNLMAIGIMHDVEKFYSNSTRIDSIDDLSSILFANVINML